MGRRNPMRRYSEQYDALKAELQTLGFVRQGSIQTRRLRCGKPACRCHRDPDARHGPYRYWTHKVRGKTVSLLLSEDELALYQEWLEKQPRTGTGREGNAPRLVARARPHNRPGGPRGPLRPRVADSPAPVMAAILRTLRPTR